MTISDLIVKLGEVASLIITFALWLLRERDKRVKREQAVDEKFRIVDDKFQATKVQIEALQKENSERQEENDQITTALYETNKLLTDLRILHAQKSNR